jgi:hypothetical protein
MSSHNLLLYLLNDDDDSSAELFHLLNSNFVVYNYYEYFSDADEDDELPELINYDELNNIWNSNEIQNNSLYDEYTYKDVVTEEVYENLKTQNIKYKDLDEVEKKENIECSISLEKFNEEDYIIKLDCGHFFHKEPILYWLYMQKNKCPLCRYEYPFINKRII